MNEFYAAQASIPDYVAVEHPEYVEHIIERMKQEAAIKAFNQIYEVGTPIVLETHLEQWQDWERVTKYVLHYRLTKVQSRNVVIPVFTFTNHEGHIEWKCPACGIVNKIEATYCGELHKHAVGCGRPRDEVRNECP